MLKIKKIILLSSLSVIIPSPIFSVLGCSTTPKIEYFYSEFNSPYKELEMFVATLNKTNSKFSYEDNSTLSFSEKASIVNNSMKQLIKNFSNIEKIKKLTDLNSTVLFVKNDSLSWNGPTKENINEVNQFWIEQPILYSQIYSSPDSEEIPGLGFLFPTPINSDANSLFDDWFEIGAKQMNSAHNKLNISERLVSAFQGTADFVFYLYDSNLILNEKDFIDFVSNNETWASKLLKQNSQVNHVIPIDIQWMYNGIWDQIGNFVSTILFASIFDSISENQVIRFDKLISNWNSIVSNDIKTYIENSKWKPWEDVSKLIKIVPKENQEDHQNFLTTYYNLIGHSFSLGILPNYIIKYNNRPLKYSNLPAYLEWFKPETNFISDNKLSNTADLKELKLNALAANRSKLGTSAIWPLKNNNIRMDTTPNELGSLCDKLGIKKVYSERNDSLFTRVAIADLKIWDTNKKQITTIEKFTKGN